MKARLGEQFTALDERDEWKLEAGKSYVVTRGGTSIAAFTVGGQCVANRRRPGVFRAADPFSRVFLPRVRPGEPPEPAHSTLTPAP